MSLSPTARTPQTSFSIDFGASGSTPGAAAERILVWGNRIGADITATLHTDGTTGVENYTFAAGLAPLDQATQVFGADDLRTQVGPGSELELDVLAVFAQEPTANVWVVPVTEGGTDPADAIITPTITTLAAGTVRVYIAGRVVEFTVTAADDVHTVGLALARAINRAPALPVVATNTWSTGAVAITYKHLGARGNYCSIRVELIGATQTVTATAGALAASLFGLTLTLSGGAAVGGVYFLAGGAGEDNWSTAITNVAPARFGRHAAPAYLVTGAASANLARLADQLDTSGGIGQQFAQQAVFGCAEALTPAGTLASTLNRARCQVAWHFASDATPGEIASQVAAARLFGDVQVVEGDAIDGELTSPAANLNGVELASIPSQRVIASQPTPAQLEAALATGLSPLAPSPTRSGRSALVASIVSRCRVGGAPNYAVYKTGEVTVSDWVRDAVVADLRKTFRGYKITNDTADGMPPRAPKTTTPKAIRARILTLLKKYEARGYIVEVDARAATLTVTRNVINPRRVDVVMPVVPAPDMDIITGAEQQLQANAG